MYSDNELTPCPDCGDLGLMAPNLYGKMAFHHKRPSHLEGYFTFSLVCKIVNQNVVGNK